MDDPDSSPEAVLVLVQDFMAFCIYEHVTRIFNGNFSVTQIMLLMSME
jgi:hypothetical protein